MIQDRGPRHNLGFGVPVVRGESDPEAIETGIPVNSGAVAKALGERPLLKFAAVATASLVGMHMAGKVARAGGHRLAYQAQELAAKNTPFGNTVREGLVSVRKIQEILDQYEGVYRQRVDPTESGRHIFVRRGENGEWLKDNVQRIDSAKFRSTADNLPDWQLRDEIQQRLVRQARRLPYELPGFYAVDKAINDPLLGNDQDRKVNWSNPVDVIGDFAWESTKNVAFAVTPFELATSSGAQTFRRLQKTMSSPGGPSGTSTGVLTTQVLLEQLGVKGDELLTRAIKSSKQTMGAFSQAVEAASQERRSLADLARSLKYGMEASPGAKVLSGDARRQMNKRLSSQATQRQFLDALPGPFSGTGTAIRTFRTARRQIGETFDDLQDVRAGRVGLADLPTDARRNRVIAMNAGDNVGPLANVARQLEKMGLKTVETSAGVVQKSDSELARVVKTDHYKDILKKNLINVAGMDEADATAFLTHSSRIALPGSGRRNLISDFRLTKTPTQNENINSWFNQLVDDAGQHQINMRGVTLKKFKSAVAVSDARYSTRAERAVVDSKIQSPHSHIVNKVAPDLLGEQVASNKIDFFSLKNNLQYNENFLVRNAAKAMGVRGFDESGQKIGLDVLKREITSRGIDASDKKRLLGLLVDSNVVRGPNAGRGLAGALGFKQLTVDEALDSTGYYAGFDKGVTGQIRSLLSKRAGDAVVDESGRAIAGGGLAGQTLPGVYRTPSGNILDFGRMKRDFVGAVDSVLSETQVPILNFTLADISFYNSWMSVRRAAPIQFASKYSKQVAATGDKTANAGLYMFMRPGNRASGKLFRTRTDAFGSGVEMDQMPGDFKPFLTNRLSRTGQYAEIFLNSPSAPRSSAQSRRAGRVFDVATEQDSNMFFGSESLLGRTLAAVRRTPAANKNPRRAARVFGRDDFNIDQIDGNLSKGVDDIIRELKGYGLNDSAIVSQLRRRGYLSSTADYDKILGYDDLAKIVDPAQAAPAAQVPNLARKILDDDLASHEFNDGQRSSLRGLQGSIRGLLRGGDEQSGFWDLPSPPNIRTTGVSRRMDQLKSELSEYMFLREGVLAPGGFSNRIGALLAQVDDLHARGVISSVEKAEARASALSLQLQFSKSQVLRDAADKGAGVLARIPMNRDIVNHAIHSQPAQTKALLTEFGQYQTQHQGLLGGAVRGIRQALAPARYDGPPVIDAIGADYTFLPTVATGFRNNPIATMAGLMGGTWRNKESITSGSIYSAHLVNRINKYFGSIGLAVDPNNYTGPLDLYARGIIGKRVLPIFAAGTTAVAVDRQLGGMVNEDEQGNPVYSPLVIGGLARGVVEGQSILAGITPGGQTYQEKKDELLTGEVPIRQGRYWLLNSNTPFKGGRIQYFRPSWYQRLQAGGEYTPEMNQTPIERLAFGYDFSPLRPLDPYRFERENYTARPYPVSGDYFSGPFGPLTSMLNATAGKVLKPSIRMHETETAAGLASYAPVGASGAVSMSSVSQSLTGINASYSALAGAPGTSSVEPFYNAMGYTQPRGFGSSQTVAAANSVASMYSNVAEGGQYPGVYMPMLGGIGMDKFGAQVVPSQAVSVDANMSNRARRAGYETQEMAGIYGFGFSSMRSSLGLGGVDFAPSQAVLESASRGYSSSRSFWNLNLGGAGDVPLPIEGRFASLEFSEIIRRFVPREQQGIQYINPIRNDIGREFPWLPDSIRQGDPYNMPDASIRLPGTGRDRVQKRYGSTPGGQYGPIDMHDILADLDPFGDNYRQIDRMVDTYAVTATERAKVAQTRAQVAAVGIKNEFTPYKYKYMDPTELVGEAAGNPINFTANKIFENLAHRDTFFNSKFLRTRTALEDWERDNVYGATYPSWNTPYSSFIEPIINRSTQRNPLAAASAAGAIGYLFGKTPRAKAMGGMLGAVIGGSASAFGSITEAVTGDRFVPRDRKRQLALEEQADILSYTHAMVNASRALEMGDTSAAQQFLQASTRTMYGANLNATPEQLAMAIPKRKREHFEAMMYAPEQEREQILSTAGRLERRMLQAAWGMRVEKLPDLNEYFQDRELPPPESGFWSPYTDMDAVKIKMGQNMGIDMAQMGYYPQQIQEANLINPAYPAVFSQTSERSTRQRLNELLRNMGVRGSVEARPSSFSNGDRFQLTMGVG